MGGDLCFKTGQEVTQEREIHFPNKVVK